MYLFAILEIWHMAEDEAKKLWKSGRRVVIFDAAVLIKAGWQTNMHQVGSSIRHWFHILEILFAAMSLKIHQFICFVFRYLFALLTVRKQSKESLRGTGKQPKKPMQGSVQYIVH